MEQWQFTCGCRLVRAHKHQLVRDRHLRLANGRFVAELSSARPLRGITTIGAGRLVILIESDAAGAQDSAPRTAFLDTWFGGTSPAGLQIGF
jgi:hypothetical protein